MRCSITRTACKSNPPNPSPVFPAGRGVGRAEVPDRRPKVRQVLVDARLVRAVALVRTCRQARVLVGPVREECPGRGACQADQDLADLDLADLDLADKDLVALGPEVGASAGSGPKGLCKVRSRSRLTSSSDRATRPRGLLRCGHLRTTFRQAGRRLDCRSGSQIPGLDFRRS
jgi:hypothetical protein